MKDIIIIGAGGFGREVKLLIDQINKVSMQWNFIGYVDDGIPKGEKVDGYSILGSIENLGLYSSEIYVIIALGNPIVKKRIVQKLAHSKTIHYPVLIHPNVQLNKTVSIEEGSIICNGSLFTVNIKIGKHVIVNLGCTIGHDTVIGNYSSFMPGVNISGEVITGECVYGGTGSKIINQVTIGENVTIGAGAVVVKNIPSDCTAVGIPAKPLMK